MIKRKLSSRVTMLSYYYVSLSVTLPVTLRLSVLMLSVILIVNKLELSTHQYQVAGASDGLKIKITKSDGLLLRLFSLAVPHFSACIVYVNVSRFGLTFQRTVSTRKREGAAVGRTVSFPKLYLLAS